MFFILLPEISLASSAFSHPVRPRPFPGTRGLYVQKKEFPLPPFAISCLRESITSLMRDKSLPLADTDLLKSQVEHTRIHLLGFDFMFSSSAS